MNTSMRAALTETKYRTRQIQKDSDFQILTGIAILLVILGHLDLQVLTIWGLFPYYSFHVMIFLFVSGYFYKEECEERVLSYILKKAKHLLLPYFCWNLFYGLLIQMLHLFGFGYGENLSIRSFFLEPFLGGHQYMLHFPAWFVPALFLIQVMNVLGRKILSILHLKKEWLILSVTLVMGMLVVYLAKGGHVWGLYKTPGRLLFMLPCFEMGCFYKRYIDGWTRENIRNGWILFGASIVLQAVLTFCCGGLAFSAVWCTSFANGPYVPYLTTITGTLFWLQIAKGIDFLKEKKVLSLLAGGLRMMGDRSFDLMMHHVFGFFVLNSLFYALARKGVDVMASFDVEKYKNSVDYVFRINEWQGTGYLYLVVGILVALCMGWIEKEIRYGYSICRNDRKK